MRALKKLAMHKVQLMTKYHGWRILTSDIKQGENTIQVKLAWHIREYNEIHWQHYTRIVGNKHIVNCSLIGMQFLKSFAVNKCDLQLTRLHPCLTKLIACLKSRYRGQISKFPPMNCTIICNYAHNVIIKHVKEGPNNLVVRGQITWFTTIRAS